MRVAVLEVGAGGEQVRQEILHEMQEARENMNALMKEGMTLAESEFNKTLLDLEIYGLVRVSWVTKEKRRIELVADSGTAS